MENTITFTYNPYIYFHSFSNALENLRKHYPSEDVFVYFDKDKPDLNKFLEVADKYKCKISIRGVNVGYIKRDEDRSLNTIKMNEWLNRLIYTCENTNSKWIMLFEDDVLIKRKIRSWPETDCGKNRSNSGFLGGGSIFKREQFLDSIKKVDLGEMFNSSKIQIWAGDTVLKYIFRNNNSTESKWSELAEPEFLDYTDHAVFHGYKKLHELG